MEDYSFWADLLATYRASPDIVKALWLMVPLVLAASLFALAVGTALRLTERRGEAPERPPEESDEELSGHEWRTAVAQPPLIEHQPGDASTHPLRRR